MTHRSSRGYIEVFLGHRIGWKYLHRILLEEKLGRKLRPWELCHHINGVKDDNRPENLESLTWKQHAYVHEFHRHGGRGRPKGSRNKLSGMARLRHLYGDV